MGLAAIGMFGLSGCASQGLTDPYFITVANQTVDKQTQQALFSICYNKVLHTPESLTALLRQHCANPQLRYNGSDLERCSLSAPARATYACTAISRTATEAKPNLPESDNFSGAIIF